MVHKKLSFYSKTYPPVSYTGQDELFLQIGRHQIQVLVRSGIQNIPEAWEQFDVGEDEDWTEILKSVLQQSELLRRNFSERHIAFSFPEVLVIPESKFSSSTTKDLCNLMFGEQHQAWIGYKKLPRHLQMMLAFRIHPNIMQWITERFPSYDTTHIYAEIIQQGLQTALPNENKVHLFFSEKSFVMMLVSGGQLLCIQTFDYTTDDDVMYELLNALHQLHCIPANTSVVISGTISSGSDLAEKMKQLFAQVDWYRIDPIGIFEQAYEQNPVHYFTLLQQWLL